MKILVGNWKSNGTRKDKQKLLTALNKVKTETKVILCLPFTLLYGDKTKISIGAQDISLYPNGAYTGDISGEMLKDTGAKYVIVGHSERRKYHHETNQIVKAKATIAIQNGITPIVCVGESESEHKNGKTKSVIKKMLTESVPDDGKFIVAYEPRWAIGTGITPTKSEVESIHNMIFDVLKGLNRAHTPILYGGSIKASNVKKFIDIPHVDGLMAGRASLKTETFLPIIKNMN